MGESAQFGIFLGWETDLDWWLQRVGKTKVQPPSVLSFGKQSSVTQMDRSTSKQIVLESLYPNKWVFRLKSLEFVNSEVVRDT